MRVRAWAVHVHVWLWALGPGPGPWQNFIPLGPQEEAQSPVGPLAIGWDIEPVCQRILRQGPSIKEEPVSYVLRDFREDLGKAR